MDFALLPPEINSARMYTGVGAGPLLAAAAAWDILAAELHATGAGYQSTITELAAGWAGPSAAAMAATAAPYATWMHTAAAHAEQTAAQAKAAAAAYEGAFAMTVPPPVIASNRSLLMALLATNFLGQNSAAIAATEAHYAEMWAQDATAMYTYAGSAAAAAILEPFTPAPQAGNPTGSAAHPASQAGALGHTAASQLASVPQALQSLTAPAAVTLGSDPPLSTDYLSLAITMLGSLVVDSIGTFGVDALGTFVIDVAGLAIGAFEAELLQIGGVAAWAGPVLASTGQAALVSGLSVPAAWTMAAPAATGAIATLASSSAAVDATAPALPFGPMAAAGAAAGAAARAGQGASSGPVTSKRKQPEASPRRLPPVKGPITGISDKLRYLAKLREFGLLSEEKFTEKKHRLLDAGRTR